ncbi:MAG TPA: LLM class flavin-dependent oxidoreductase [Candidatus Binatia bacterium]|jgi:probable F420-dependent oxidoreductase
MSKVGLCIVNPAPQIQSGYVTAVAKKCDEMGLDSVWDLDRIVYDNLEPLTLLAAAAAVTSKIRLGTSVLLAALRHPTLLAKIVSTLDFLSSGRITLGIGFGSRENDFTSVEIPYEHRGSRAEELVGLVKRLWTEENVTYKGRFYQIDNVTIGPPPVQTPHPPIWMGGSAETALKRAARLADGYICGSSAIPEFPRVWEKITAFAASAGRDPAKIAKAGLTFMAIDDDKAKAVAACEAYLNRYYGKVRLDVEKTLVVGSAEACAERIRAAFANGLETLIVGAVIPDLKQLDLLGEKILPQLNKQ